MENGIRQQRIARQGSLSFLQSRREKWEFVLLMTIYTPLFLLIFQPFGVNNYDPSQRISGTLLIALIVFGMINGTVLAIYEFALAPWLFRRNNWPAFLLRLALSMLLLSAVTFLVYNLFGNFHDWRWSSFLGFVRDIPLMYLMPLVIILLFFNYREVRRAYEQIQREPKPAPGKNELIWLQAEHGSDRLGLTLENLLFVEAQDNYVTIYHLEKDQVKKSLLRIPLKKLEQQLAELPVLRCHRSFMVNMCQVEKVTGNAHQLRLHLPRAGRSIPVSRSYIVSLQKHLDIHPTGPDLATKSGGRLDN